jgi:hypothetical protein
MWVRLKIEASSLYADIVPLDVELVAEVAKEFPYPPAAVIVR